MGNTTSTTSGTGTAYHPGTPEFTPGLLSGVNISLF